MTGHDDDVTRDLADEGSDQESREASLQVGHWSPWIWVIPAIAIFVVGYLVVRYGLFGGGDVTVRFSDARGLERYSPVRYRGAKVGTVQKISIDDELEEVIVRISMDAAMDDALRMGTSFWIVEPGLESGGLGGLLGGTYIGMEPGKGEPANEFEGQEYPPILTAPEPGKTFVLESDNVGFISIGAPVQFEGTRVGRVLGTRYDTEAGTGSVYVFVVERFASQVRESTRFWRTGGVSISTEGGKISMGDVSLATLLNSGIAFYTPGIFAGDPASEGAVFELHGSRPAAIASADGPHMTYLTYFPGAIGGLAPGTSVRMKGVKVGRVRDVRLRYVPENATLEAPVTLEIDPRLLDIQVYPGETREDLRARMNDALEALVQNGMRANLTSSLFGSSSVSLETSAAPGTGRLAVEYDPPVIPAVAGGSGLDDAIASLNRVAATLEDLPLRETMSHLRSAAERVDSLVSDPALQDSVQRLNAALTDIQAAAQTTNENIGPIAEKLRSAATAAEAAASRAQELVGSAPKQNYDLAELIRELTRAAEAVRALASYLTENPDALLKGRAE